MLVIRSARAVIFLLLWCVVIIGACPPLSAARTSQEVRPTTKGDEARSQYDKGLDHLRQKEYEKAAQAFTNALSQGYRTADVFYYRGRAYLLLKRYEKALADATKAIELQPDHASAYLLRANASVHLDRLRDALEDLDQGLAITPNPILPQLYGARGVAYLSLKEPEKALQDLTKAIDLENTVPLVYYHRGKVLTQLGRYEEAFRDFSIALTKQPAHYDTLVDRGWVSGCLGDYKKSLSDLNKALSQRPNDLPVHGLRGWVALMLDDVEMALSDLRYAAEHGSKDPWVYLKLSAGLYRTGRLDEALQANDRAFALKNSLVEAALYFQKGGLLLANERYDDARAAYERGKALAEKAPDRVELDDAISDLRAVMNHRPQLKKIGEALITMLETARDKIPATARRDPTLCQRPRSTGLKELRGGGS